MAYMNLGSIASARQETSRSTSATGRGRSTYRTGGPFVQRDVDMPSSRRPRMYVFIVCVHIYIYTQVLCVYLLHLYMHVNK